MSTQPLFLIVDDYDQMRRVLVSNLKTLGYTNMITASNGEDAIRKLNANPVNVILSDWNMPQMTGLELLEWVRKDKKYRFTPFIMITAEIERQQVEKAIAAGVSDFILKPFSSGTLSEKIRKNLQKTPVKTPIPTVKPQESEASPFDAPVSADVEIKVDTTLTILAVDDVPDNLTLISSLLENDYRVKVASNGQKAIKICQSADKPNLVLLDVMMPDMDGFDVIKELKANEETSDIPVIFFTAMDEPDSIIKGLEAGAVDYVTKPIKPTVLKARVGNFLRYHRGYEELKNTLDTMMENAKLRDDVEHIVRHDMKSPLAAIIGTINSVGKNESITQEQLKTIEDLSYTLLNMVNLSTDLYKIETGRFQLNAKPVDIVRLTEKVAEEIRLGFSTKNIKINTKIQVAGELFAFGDELLSYSMLHNLIKNAAEAAPAGSAVFITVDSGENIKVSIRNLGVVPESIRDNFFDKFVTVGKRGGTGLGTYSARLIAEAQNGSISMSTSEDSGTTVEVTLPRATV
ncbi:response regulator [Candidatus Magnetomonas plexicatena]|uniref:response regulator n=1 Tax=Candidatus Magnetomonas plexicatena TaxID=2552947 RepID=UPI001C788881|nr:response regulator [Nitrospirales bacterium LBB_01]